MQYQMNIKQLSSTPPLFKISKIQFHFTESEL